MKEKLRTIQESFEILQEEENRIKSKKEKDMDDERDLEAIDILRQELISTFNDILNEDNKKQQEEMDIFVKEDKLTKNKKRLEEIEYLSKKQYPKIEGRDKNRKKEILESEGFISTNGFDGREVFISKDLVGEYFDLVRETKPLVEEQNRRYYEDRRKEELANRTPSIQSSSSEEISVSPEITSLSSIASQEEIPLEEEFHLTRAKLMNLLLERDKPNQGKKQFVRFEGEPYYLPKTRLGEFKALNTQYNSLRKKLRDQNSGQERVTYQENIIPLPREDHMIDNSKKEEPIDSSGAKISPFMDEFITFAANTKPKEGQVINLPSGESETHPDESFGASLDIHSDEEASQYTDEDVENIFRNINRTFGIGTDESADAFSEGAENPVDDDSDVIDLVNKRSPREGGNFYDWSNEGFETPEESSRTSGETPEVETSEESSRISGETPEVETSEDELSEVREPKAKGKIRNWIKKHKQTLIRAIAGFVGAVMIITGIKALPKDNRQVQETEGPTTTTTDEDLDKTEASTNEMAFEIPKAPVTNPQLEEMVRNTIETEQDQQLAPEVSPTNAPQANDSEGLTDDETYSYDESEENILIGSSVNVNEGSNIYARAEDSILEENAYHPYYDSNIDRVVLGVSIDYNGQVINVLANSENYNQTIMNLLNDGGQIVSVLTANQEKVPESFDGTQTMTSSEINNVAEGFYNINDIYNPTNSNGRGR